MKTSNDHKAEKKPPEAAKAAADKSSAAKAALANDDETIESRPDPKSSPAPVPAVQGADSQTGDAKKPPKEQPATVNMPAVGRMTPLASKSPAQPAVPPTLTASGKLLDKKVAYRHWLETKSKEELVDMIIWLETSDPALDVTEKMMKTQSTGVLATQTQTAYQPPADLEYVRLPRDRQSNPVDPLKAWQIVMLNIDQTHPPLGFIIDDEITVGRQSDSVSPDIDLTPYGASSKGVSRLHARMRPSANSLSLVDNDSTNGTFRNRLSIRPGAEQALTDGDVITFGKVNFLLRLIKSPEPGSK